MKALFHVPIKTNARSGPTDYARKEIELNGIPSEGVAIQSSAWHEPRRIRQIVLDVDDGSLFIRLEEHSIVDDDMGLQAFSYIGHGWSVSDDLLKASQDYSSRIGLP